MKLDSPARLTSLHASGLLDSRMEEEFDRITRLASKLLRAPIALLSLVDTNRQFFKSQIGLPLELQKSRETPLSHSFCKHIVDTEERLIVLDATTDERVAGNPAIIDLNVMAYAGIPLRTSDGQILGAFCVIDREVRNWTNDELESLEDLAAMVLTEIDLRTALRHERSLRDENADIARTLQSALLPPVMPDIAGVDIATAYLPQGSGEIVGGDFYDVFEGADGRSHIIIGDVMGKGVTAARTSMLVRHVARAAALRGETSAQSFQLVDESLRQQSHPFVAAQQVVLECRDGLIHCDVTIAGQPLPLLLKDGKVDVIGEYGMVLGSGLASIPTFGEASCVLAPGDVLMLFTDGVTDNPIDGLTELQLSEHLNETRPLSAEQAVQRLVALSHFGDEGRPPIDDIAIVAIGNPL